MQAVRRQDEQHDEIRNHHGQVECVGMINVAECFVGQLVPILDNRALLGREQMGESQQV